MFRNDEPSGTRECLLLPLKLALGNTTRSETGELAAAAAVAYCQRMRILALDAALGRCSAAVVIDGQVVASSQQAAERGQAALLAPMVHAVLTKAALAAVNLEGVAVTVGPGSFTGLRAAIALAHGIALAADVPVVGVTVAEAMAEALPQLDGRTLWVAIDSRRGRVFLHRGGAFMATALTELPPSGGRIAVAGDAAVVVAGWLAGRDDDVMLTDVRLPAIGDVAAVGARRLRGELPPLAAQPLYIDPPEAKLPAGGLRPSPTAAAGGGG